jgi:hypothetical protein
MGKGLARILKAKVRETPFEEACPDISPQSSLLEPYR